MSSGGSRFWLDVLQVSTVGFYFIRAYYSSMYGRFLHLWFTKKTAKRLEPASIATSVMVLAYSAVICHSRNMWGMATRACNVKGGACLEYPLLQNAGAAIFAAGVLLFWHVHHIMRDAWDPYVTERPDASLVVSGPFRLTRHPMYTSMAVVGLGSSMALVPVTSWWVAVLWAAFLVLGLMRRIPVEEAHLFRQFGKDYEAYAKVVPWKLIPYVY